MKNAKILRLLALLFAFALVAAACSDDGDDSASDDTTAATDDSAAADTDDTAAADDDMADDTAADTSDQTIVEIASENPEFSTLVEAVTAANLAETLSGEGPYTVFAPTNDAFAALPAGTLDTLLADPEGQLADILLYHVVEGEVLAEQVVELDGQEVTTVNGASVTVGVTDDGVTLTDGAGNTVNVVQTDIVASNGVIHVIDAVLLPSAG